MDKFRNISAAAAAMARKRLYSMTADERTALASKAGKKSWAGMTAGERHLESKRRAITRRRNRMKALADKTD